MKFFGLSEFMAIKKPLDFDITNVVMILLDM